MNTADAVYEFLKMEVVPVVSGGSEFTAAIINGALRAGKKKLTAKLADNPLLQATGIVNSQGVIDQESFAEFADGMFDGKDSISISLAEMIKFATGVESASPLLEGKLKFTRSDADKFLELLKK